MALSSVVTLEENPSNTYLEITSFILEILDNIIKCPYAPSNRHIHLSNDQVINKLLSGIGAMECLFELGFQEGDSSLVLPFHASLEELVDHRNEIAMRRSSYLSTRSLIRTSDNRQLYLQIDPLTMDPLMQKIFYFYNFVLEYENPELQQAARRCIPLVDLEIAAERNLRKIQLMYKGSKREESVTIRDFLLMELVSWFKNSFFVWVDSPSCTRCGGPTYFLKMCSDPWTISKGEMIELHACDRCGGATTPFQRHDDPWKLLETRKGRCGEWASCFTLFCRSLGFDARLVYDFTDHLWTEVYCLSDNPHWVHVDPCEGVVDAPLMYENGWRKQLSCIFGFSSDGIQDVTWRYTCMPPEEILLRRQELGVKEEELIAAILNLRQERYKSFSDPKKKYYIRRTACELAEFLWTKNKESQIKEEEKRGRISGSLAWRLERSEFGSETFLPYVWQLSESERDAREFTVKYSCSSDKYLKIIENKEMEVKGWKSGLFEKASVFRKEERDWKVVYLAREDGSTEGSIKFKFDLSPSGSTIDTISILCKSAAFENGNVLCILCGGDICSRVPTGESVMTFQTASLEGLQTFTLEMKLSGGKGPVAWQHAQLFRQPLTDTEQYPLVINVKLKRPKT